MKIAVISDIHDRLDNLSFVIDELNTMGIKKIICCGDLCSPIPAKLLAKQFKGDIYTVFGNTADRENTPKVSITFPNFHHMGDVGEIKLDNKKIAFVHYPEMALNLAKSNKYDFVFYGHTHKAASEMINDCLLLNPGEILGYRSTPSYAIVDLETKEFNFIQI